MTNTYGAQSKPSKMVFGFYDPYTPTGSALVLHHGILSPSHTYLSIYFSISKNTRYRCGCGMSGVISCELFEA